MPYGFGLSIEEVGKLQSMQPPQTFCQAKSGFAEDDDDRMLYTYQAK